MRQATMLLAVILIALGGTVFTPGPASAGPAQPYTEDFCQDFSEADGLHTICFQTKGASVYTETPSGNYHIHDSGQTCFQHYINGELVEQGCRKFNFVTVVKDGLTQVDHWNIRFAETAGGATCTGFFLFQYANDAIRRDVSIECV